MFLCVTGALLVAVPLFVQAGSMRVTSYAGPYDIAVLDLRSCPEDETGKTDRDLYIVGQTHHNTTLRLKVWDGNFTIKDNMGRVGTTELKLDFAKWDSVAGWREHFLVMPLGEMCVCFADVLMDLFLHLSKSFENLPPTCPFPDGFYSGENVPAKVGHLRHFPVLPYARFKVNAFGFPMTQSKLKSDKRPRFCVRLVVDVVPKLKETPRQ